ncbi:MAG: hypothetical protein M1306_00065 [Candidatus Thermoplasmatota archaeon]|jgi:hypothetical protein|nr:hypothetical protein [Candidatus Thermoplasmatota archaeon]
MNTGFSNISDITFLAISREDISQPVDSDISAKIKNKQFPVISNQNEISMNERMSYDSVFMIVKKAVKAVTGHERSGLGLALSNLPAGLGAFWQVGGNYIVMNDILINAMEKIAKNDFEFNSFIFTILIHEYLHSIGYYDESDARKMSHYVTSRYFGEKHPTTVMSSDDLWRIFPQLRYIPGGDGSYMRIISKFDTDATSYIA